MPKINVAALHFVARGGYPPPHDKLVAGRSRKRLGDEAGLTQFGVNLTKLKPGAFSSLRHWHENQDEFVFLIEGELTLIEDQGETVIAPKIVPGGRCRQRSPGTAVDGPWVRSTYITCTRGGSSGERSACRNAR
jgi:hypothetical protein